MVRTVDGAKAMKDVKVGDMILSNVDNALSYTPVMMFLHRQENEWAEFYQVETIHNEKLKLTANHLIYFNDCNPKQTITMKYAKDLKVGECTFVATKAHKLVPSKVRGITKVREQGIYAPLTTSGSLIANNVLASCYANLNAEPVHQTIFGIISTFSDAVSMLSSNFISNNEDLPLGISTMMHTLTDVFPSKYL